MKRKLYNGTRRHIETLFLQDVTSQAGSGLTGLTISDLNLQCAYVREGDQLGTSVPLAAGTVGSYIDASTPGSGGGFVEVDATRLPGLYQLSVPDLAFQRGPSIVLMLYGGHNMLPCVVELELDAVQYQDPTAFGLARLDAAVSSRATPAQVIAGGGPPLLSTNGQVDVDLGQALLGAQAQGTVGRALQAAVAEGFGRWVWNRNATPQTLTLYDEGGQTILRTFTLTGDSLGNVTART